MENSGEGRDKKKFLLYILYAWGLPLIILLITAIMELHPDVPESYLKPKFKRTCWFESEDSRMAYYIAPVGFIILCNIVLFLVTACNIFKMEKETKILKMSDSRRHGKKDDKNRFKLYIKLTIVMGVNWAMEILSSLIDCSKCIWLATDLVNTLQGIFIFLLFVCKKKVYHQLRKKLRHKIGSRSSHKVGEGWCLEVVSASTSATNMSSTAVNGNIRPKKKNVLSPTEQTRNSRYSNFESSGYW